MEYPRSGAYMHDRFLRCDLDGEAQPSIDGADASHAIGQLSCHVPKGIEEPKQGESEVLK
jgi:hypothetical protein